MQIKQKTPDVHGERERERERQTDRQTDRQMQPISLKKAKEDIDSQTYKNT